MQENESNDPPVGDKPQDEKLGGEPTQTEGTRETDPGTETERGEPETPAGPEAMQGVDEKIQLLRNELQETKDKYLRALAELENYKKRALKERSELLKYQGESVLFDFLSVLDNMELALQHTGSDPEKLREGVKLIHKLFIDTLGKWDVRSESSLGKDFNPQTHHALSRLVLDDAPPNSVVAEPKKAYFYKDKLLRAGEAVVAMEKPKEETPDEGDSESAAEDGPGDKGPGDKGPDDGGPGNEGEE